MIKLTLPVLAKLGFGKSDIYATLENRMKCGLGKCGRELSGLGELQQAVKARIVEIARTDPDPGNRRYCAAALDYVVGFKVLEETARSDPDPEVRRAAARARMEPELQIAAQRGDSATVLKASDPEVRRHGVEMLNDQAGLAKAAQKDPDAGVRAAAVRRLEDQTLLARIAEKDKDEKVYRAAIDEIKNRKLLAELATKGPDAKVRMAAIEKLTDGTLLAQIARSAVSSDERAAAETRLRELAQRQ